MFTLILLGTHILILVLVLLQFLRISRLENRASDIVTPMQDAIRKGFTEQRQEISQNMHQMTQATLGRMTELATLQKNQLDSFSRQLMEMTALNDKRILDMRQIIENQLKQIQEDNSKKLEQMRQTVDEKLHKTLETRFGESFKVVSDRLELVHKGLGEMQSLATGVGDLKRVLSNVKTRGTWGEIQLGNLLEQILTGGQYDKNVATKLNSSDRVEFAIRLPGKDNDMEKPVWLPIDAKFPLEAYQRLLDAQDRVDPVVMEEADREIEISIKKEAATICEKYISPPQTTDFAIMYIPIEGLYAWIISRAGLCEFIQNKYRISVAGPTTLTAILNSLQLGFRTLAIEKRSSDVWKVLETVKVEFSKFGDILDKTHKKLQEASNVIDSASKKSRSIEQKLRRAEQNPLISSEYV